MATTARPGKRAPSRLKLVAGAAEEGLTLVEFVSQRGGIALEDARAAIERGGAYVEQKRVKQGTARVHKGEHIEVMLRERGELPRELPALEDARILHLDAQLVAVDKPAGVLAQEGRAGGASLVELVEKALRARQVASQALLVHRLDRGTTGVTLLARTSDAQAHLLEAFRAGQVKKEYRLLVQGAPASDRFASELRLGADPLVQGRRKVDPQGETAHTDFEVLERFGSAALVCARPTTGRTHQIRVHLAALGHPLLGDARYGGPVQHTRPDGARLDFTRPLLHAASIELVHPLGHALSVRAPEPEDLSAACAFLRAGARAGGAPA